MNASTMPKMVVDFQIPLWKYLKIQDLDKNYVSIKYQFNMYVVSNIAVFYSSDDVISEICNWL